MLPTALLIACGTPQANFRDASSSDLASVYASLTGTGQALAQSVFVQYASMAQKGATCPEVREGGLGHLFEGGCTDDEGVSYSGSAESTDVLSGVAFEFKASAWEHDEEEGLGYRFDGSGATSIGDDLVQTLEMDLWTYMSAGFIPFEFRSTGSMSCDLSTSMCTLGGGFEGEVMELGVFEGDGEYAVAQNDGELRARSRRSEVVFTLGTECIEVEVDGDDEGCLY